MAEINKDIEKYLSQVKAYLPCKKSDKVVILADIRQAISEFAENSDIQSIDDIYKRFGTPEEIAKAYLSDAEPKKITNAINIRKVVIAAVVAALLVFTGFVTAVFLDLHGDSHGTFTVTIAEEGTYNIDAYRVTETDFNNS